MLYIEGCTESSLLTVAYSITQVNVQCYVNVSALISTYLHFCQGLETLEQIFGQCLEIIVGQAPDKEEDIDSLLFWFHR